MPGKRGPHLPTTWPRSRSAALNLDPTVIPFWSEAERIRSTSIRYWGTLVLNVVETPCSSGRPLAAWTTRAAACESDASEPPDRADQAFNISVLPGRAERGGPVPDAHCSHASLERDAECSVIVADEIFRCPLPRKRFGDLAYQPLGRRISGHPIQNNRRRPWPRTRNANSCSKAIVGTTKRSIDAIPSA
jgi:hypothetical protein